MAVNLDIPPPETLTTVDMRKNVDVRFIFLIFFNLFLNCFFLNLMLVITSDRFFQYGILEQNLFLVKDIKKLKTKTEEILIMASLNSNVMVFIKCKRLRNSTPLIPNYCSLSQKITSSLKK